jgi:hypothetical protein
MASLSARNMVIPPEASGEATPFECLIPSFLSVGERDGIELFAHGGKTHTSALQM